MHTLLLVLLATVAYDYTGPKIGEAAPDFTLTDHTGQPVTLSKLKGKVVVLEWTNKDCPFVVRHYDLGTMKTLAERYAPKQVVWLAINSSHFANVEQNAGFVKARTLPYRVLDDHSGTVGRAYGARTTPHMYVVDAKGHLAYRGAIDNNPWGDAKVPTNFVDAALTSMLAGQPVAAPLAKPYGCSVKYKD